MKKIPIANSQENVVNEIVSGEHKTIEKPIWVEDMGSWNYMPKPFKLGKIEDAIRDIISFSFQCEFRQVKDLLPKEVWNGLMSVKIFWFYNRGWAICERYEKGKYIPEAYKIGCEHKHTTEEKLDRSYYRVTCSDCGFQYEYDCSD